MNREEAISEWTFRSNHIKKWLDEYGEEPSIRHYVELIDMAIEALSTDAEYAGFPDVPRAYYEKVVGNMAREINRLKEQLESAEAEPKWNCTANFVAEQLERLKDMTDEERLKLLQTMFPSADAVMRDATAEERASVQRYIDSISTEAVQVVRCKDCRYRKKVGTSYYCELDEFNVKDADFCSWGERREP